MRHGPNPLAFLVGIIIIFFALVILRAAVRNAGEGSCLSACCLWEMGDSLLDLGCGLIGCGGTLGIALVGVLATHLLRHVG